MEIPEAFYILCGYINCIHKIFRMLLVIFTTNLLGGLAFGTDGITA